jgi:hypothetical protein
VQWRRWRAAWKESAEPQPNEEEFQGPTGVAGFTSLWRALAAHFAPIDPEHIPADGMFVFTCSENL